MLVDDFRTYGSPASPGEIVFHRQEGLDQLLLFRLRNTFKRLGPRLAAEFAHIFQKGHSRLAYENQMRTPIGRVGSSFDKSLFNEPVENARESYSLHVQQISQTALHDPVILREESERLPLGPCQASSACALLKTFAKKAGHIMQQKTENAGVRHLYAHLFISYLIICSL